MALAYPIIWNITLLWIEPRGRQLATLRAQTKTVVARAASAVLARFQEQLPALAAPYIANAQAQGYQARLTWISRRQAALEGILAEDAEPAAREVWPCGQVLWQRRSSAPLSKRRFARPRLSRCGSAN